MSSLKTNEKKKQCPRFLFFTIHTWGEEHWWGSPNPFAFNTSKYIAERKCLVCETYQQYYQGGASAGWETMERKK